MYIFIDKGINYYFNNQGLYVNMNQQHFFQCNSLLDWRHLFSTTTTYDFDGASDQAVFQIESWISPKSFLTDFFSSMRMNNLIFRNFPRRPHFKWKSTITFKLKIVELIPKKKGRFSYIRSFNNLISSHLFYEIILFDPEQILIPALTHNLISLVQRI